MSHRSGNQGQIILLQEQQVLIMTEPSLQAKTILFLVKGAHSIILTDLELRDRPTSDSWVLGLKMTATTLRFCIGSFNSYVFVFQ